MWWIVMAPIDRVRVGNASKKRRIRSRRVAMVTSESPRSTRMNSMNALSSRSKRAGGSLAGVNAPMPVSQACPKRLNSPVVYSDGRRLLFSRIRLETKLSSCAGVMLQPRSQTASATRSRIHAIRSSVDRE